MKKRAAKNLKFYWPLLILHIIGGSYYSKVSNEVKEQRLDIIKSKLNSDWTVKEKVSKAAVPLLKVIYKPLKLECKINFFKIKITKSNESLECL